MARKSSKKISTVYSKLLQQTRRAIEHSDMSDDEHEWLITRPVKWVPVRRKNASLTHKTSR